MDGDELSENVSGANFEPRRFAPVFQVLRRQADRGVRKHLGGVANRGVLDDRVRADLAVTADAHARANHRKRPYRRALANYCLRMDARAGIDVGLRRHRQQQFRFHHRLPIDFGKSGDLDEGATDRAKRDDQPEPIAGDDVPAELGVVDAS
jgi:hypothetical protein